MGCIVQCINKPKKEVQIKSDFEPLEEKLTAAEYKDKGNEYFKAGNYQEAIIMYTKAIKISPDIPILYTNRGLSYMQTNAYELAYNDGRAAVKLDPSSLKAILICSRSKANIGKKGSLPDLEKGLELAKLAYKLSESESSPENKKYCQDLVSNIQIMYEITQMNLIQKEAEGLKEYYSGILKDNKSIELLNKHLVAKKIEEIPSFSCTLTMEVYNAPYVTIAGFSYEKDLLLKHIDKNGCIDPLSRQWFHIDTLMPNFALARGSEWYKNTRPWLKFADSLDLAINKII
ncbi:unnamed protein product [Blepharisma stoltei]|uniref:RING-type E3 ubiquitin transferase n=1 Tax=Blepharisma stoltei TaxID=1481888 RepID=A0AAU9KD17_9CILI|nr:unnamed protein product [Blepharisma stoltei]